MSPRHFIRTTLTPAAYHGHNKRAPFFEGWYYKLVTPDERQMYAVIPGIYKGLRAEHSHAFVMVLDGSANRVAHHRFALDDFRASDRTLAVQVGPNLFTERALTLNLPDLRGHVRFIDSVPWPVTLTSPGIMGWYAWVPRMETYHGVVSLDHALAGTLTAGAQPVVFDGGRGYIEKDWGSTFPQTWIWLQANHFGQPGSSLTASLARIPWIGRDFPGFIIGFWHAGRLHRFTTYVGAQLERVRADDDHVHIIVRNRRHRLEIRAERAASALLSGPTRDRGMVPFVRETLGAQVSVRLTRRDRRQSVVYEGSSGSAGLEVEGDTAILLL